MHWCNAIFAKHGEKVLVKNLIISGGVRDYMDGYYLTASSKLPAVYGQASGFLKHAQGDYKTLQHHVQAQIQGLELANAFLSVREA